MLFKLSPCALSPGGQPCAALGVAAVGVKGAFPLIPAVDSPTPWGGCPPGERAQPPHLSPSPGRGPGVLGAEPLTH
jgi:hypothetical protein